MKWYFWAGAAIFAVLGAASLIPTHVTEPNLPGYYSFNPLALIISILLWVDAGTIYFLGKEKKHRQEFPTGLTNA
jgi:hypothetical protein